MRKNDDATGNNDCQMVIVGGYQVRSTEELSLNSDFGQGLVSGDELEVRDSDGNVLYENLRGFLPLSEKKHLLRYADGVWVIFTLAQRKFHRLKRENLPVAGKMLMFDERGKIHLNQVSPYYPSVFA